MLGLFGGKRTRGPAGEGHTDRIKRGTLRGLVRAKQQFGERRPGKLARWTCFGLHAGIREHVSCAAGPRPECSELRLSGRRHGQLHTEASHDHDGAGTQCGRGFAIHADSEAGKHYVVVQRITSCLWYWRCFGSWPGCAAAEHVIQELFFWAIG